MSAVTMIGLDIGSTSIRAVETTRGKHGPVITRCGQILLPPGAVSGGIVHDEQAVTGALRQLWSTAGFRGRKVVLGVTSPQVFVREMSVTNLPPRELAKALPYQVRDALPLPVERSLLDFLPLEDPGNNETVRGLLIAAPKEAVVTAVHAVEQARLFVARVDLASFALLRAASRLDEHVEAIVDIGAQATSVIVHQAGVPLIVRTIPRGGAEITQLVAQQLDCPLDQAEMIKRRIGLRSDADIETTEVVREAVRPLISEIRSSFAYLTTGDRQAEVTRLVLSGGGALLPGLPEALGNQLGVPVVAADPLSRVRSIKNGKEESLAMFRPSAAVSVGLTLGAA